MTNRELLVSHLNGDRVQHPVYAVYDWFVKNRPIDWNSLFVAGLGQINHANLVKFTYPNAEIKEIVSSYNGQIRRDVTWTTDIGELHEWYLGEWRQEHLIKTPEDYKIMARAWQGAQLSPTPEIFLESERQLGNNGITLGQIGRTPLQRIQIDYAGLVQFSMDIADEHQYLMNLLEIMTDICLKECELALQTPAKYIKLWENLTIETMGPRLYRKHMVPLYRKIFEILNKDNRQLLVHYDGKLNQIAEDMKHLPFDMDSLTAPPEGDMTIDQCRSMWPDKFFWLHPCLGWFRQSEKELLANIEQIIKQAGHYRFCLLISEEIPPDWQTKVPLVLDFCGLRLQSSKCGAQS